MGTLESRIGKPVNFCAPEDVREAGGNGFSGMVVDEVWAEPELNASPPRTRQGVNDFGDHCYCSQLIRWADGTYGLRLAYFRRRPGEAQWIFASQMTVTGEPAVMKALMERTLAREGWFRDSPEPSPASGRTYTPRAEHGHGDHPSRRR